MPDGFSNPKGPVGPGIQHKQINMSKEAMLTNPDLANFMGGVPGVRPTVPPPTPPAPQVQAPPLESKTASEDSPPPPPVLSPEEKYLEGLKRVNVTQDQAAQIVEAMIMAGMYEEEVHVTKKLTVKFRTRGQSAIDRLNRALNAEDPKFDGAMFSVIAKYNLAASLVQYAQHRFDPTTEDGFSTTMSYISNLPLPLYTAIVSKLSQFDAKVNAVMAEGCELFI